MTKINFSRIVNTIIIIINIIFLTVLFTFLVVAQAIDIIEGDGFALSVSALMTFIILLIGIPVLLIFNIKEFKGIENNFMNSLVPKLTFAMMVILILLNVIDFLKW